MSYREFAIIDPAAGISGDMLLGALVACGSSRDWLTGLPDRLGLPGVMVEIEEVDRSGVQATKVTVRAPNGSVEGPEYTTGSGAGSHGHRHLGELLERIRRAPISDWVRERATQAFRLLGEAEGRVHGRPAERVSLHEVGALDALVDIVGTVEGFEQLGVTEIYARPVALGAGWVPSAHGTLPVPAPATSYLIEGLTVGPDGPVRGEATTPTGAALLRVLSRGLPPVQWRAIRSGWGAGSRNPAGYPNALRLIVAEPAAEAAEVVVIAADLDDLSPEYLEPLRVALVEAGALDVQIWSSYMKKGRIGFRVEVVAPLGQEAAVIRAFFAHSTTAGLRWHRAARETLARQVTAVSVGAGEEVRVKILEGPDGARVKPEFDDVNEAAGRMGRPAYEVAREAGEAALDRPVSGSQAAEPRFRHEESQ
ncbi:MAG TPA: nickel pincer cofactor biosynthesis protein LarC [Gemmatimonadales bacterium]